MDTQNNCLSVKEYRDKKAVTNDMDKLKTNANENEHWKQCNNNNNNDDDDDDDDNKIFKF